MLNITSCQYYCVILAVSLVACSSFKFGPYPLLWSINSLRNQIYYHLPSFCCWFLLASQQQLFAKAYWLTMLLLWVQTAALPNPSARRRWCGTYLPADWGSDRARALDHRILINLGLPQIRFPRLNPFISPTLCNIWGAPQNKVQRSSFKLLSSIPAWLLLLLAHAQTHVPIKEILLWSTFP